MSRTVNQLVLEFTTDVIASVAFGIDCNSLKDVNAKFYTWGQKVFEPKPIQNILQFLCPSIMNLLKISGTDKGAEHFFIKAFTDVVKYRTDNNVSKKDFLDSIIKLMSKGYVEVDDGQEPVLGSKTTDKITPLEGAAQAFVFWLAGFETSSTTATHCLYELAFHQKIQDQLANEVNEVLGKFGGLTYEAIGEMQYLHKVVSETLRKYPSVPILNRECTQEAELFDTGLKISEKDSLIIPVWGIHWDPEIYPEPEKFDPERFTEENIASRHRYAYLPFGEGPRNCIGLRFGLLQTKIALATVVSQYRCLPGPDTKVPLPIDKGSFLHVPKGDVTLRLEKR